jgi:outer membrane protein TolC
MNARFAKPAWLTLARTAVALEFTAVIVAVISGSSALGQRVAPTATAQSDGGGAMPGPQSTSQTPLPSLSPSSSQASQNPLFGSVTEGTVSGNVLPLSLADAVERGLRQNLGQLLSADTVTSSQGQLVQARSDLLPNLSARISENAAQVDLAAQGFEKIAGKFPGFPTVVGPFGYFDARGAVSQSLVDLNALANARSAERNRAAAKFSYQDTREMVVLVVGATYLQTIASLARVDSADAQVKTAQALYDQAVDLKQTGTTAGIDLLRAQVELQSRQQQSITAHNDFAKQKLSLARAIGLPLGQEFTLTDTAPYEPSPAVTLADALARAYSARADFQSALAQVTAAEYARRAATAEHLPSAGAYADYGVLGPTPSQLHGVFDAYVALHIPIFAGNRARGDALIADADLARRRQQLENLRGQIEQDVRTAMLDLQSSSDQVGVAKSNVDLAQQTLTQARDRFSAGVTDNIEVVQAQQSVANANESYISSLYAYNLARVELARATGSAERGIREYWKGK